MTGKGPKRPCLEHFSLGFARPGRGVEREQPSCYGLAVARTRSVKDGMPTHKGMKTSSAAEIARGWQLEGGIGFLLRLLEARYDDLYQNVTGQATSRHAQFGVLIALYQLGPLTPSVLAERISCDRNTLSEMLKRMTARKLISKRKQFGRPAIDPGADHGRGRAIPFGRRPGCRGAARHHAGAVAQARSRPFPQMPAGDRQSPTIIAFRG